MGNSPKDLRQCVNPRARTHKWVPATPPPTHRAGLSFIRAKKRRPVRGCGPKALSRFAPASSRRAPCGSKKNAPQVTGRRSNYAHLTDINLQPHHHSFVKSTGQKNSPEMRISGPTTMLSSLNCPHHSQLASSALETTVTGESRITQVFRYGDRFPTWVLVGFWDLPRRPLGRLGSAAQKGGFRYLPM